MITSTIVYIPNGPLKAILAAVRDAEHQLLLRAIRKRPGREFDGTWTSCRCDPGIWRLSLEVRMPLVVGTKDAQQIRNAKDGEVVEIKCIACG